MLTMVMMVITGRRLAAGCALRGAARASRPCGRAGSARPTLGGAGAGADRALRARAFPTTPDPLPPPVDAMLTRVEYELRGVSGDTVAGEARLTVDVLKQGWVGLQMPAGLLVRAARIDGKPTALIDGNPPRVLISRAGRSVLTLDVVVPVQTSGGIESMALPASASALSAVTLIVPRTGIDLTVNGGFVAEQTEANAENRWVVYGCPRGVRCPSRGSARSTIGDRRCRCARGRGSPSPWPSARRRVRSPPACASRSCRDWRAISCSRRRPVSRSIRSWARRWRIGSTTPGC